VLVRPFTRIQSKVWISDKRYGPLGDEMLILESEALAKDDWRRFRSGTGSAHRDELLCFDFVAADFF